MSHFVVYVIVESSLILTKDSDQVIKERIHSLLAPYDENIRVPEYFEDCHCIGGKAKNEVNKRVEQEFGSIDEFRKNFWKQEGDQHPRSEEEEIAIEAKWRESIQPRLDAQNKYMEEHPLKETPDSDCESCTGSGKRPTTYNQLAKWDWYRVGGRWDGEIKNNRQSSENGFNFNKKHEDTTNNMILIDEVPTDIPDSWIPFAIVTPDGKWHEKGRMGWWAMVSDEKSDWKSLAKEIINKYRGDRKYLAVACDCHI